MFHKMKLEKKEQKIFIGLSILSILYILPIILADRFFVDDLGRNYLGYYWWDHNGRLLANGIMKVLSGFSTTVLDLSSLPLILGVICLAYSLVLFSKKYFAHYSSKLTVGMLFFALASPYLIENLSFKYDSLLMLLGLCFVFLCFSLPDNLPRGIYYIITSLLILGMLFLYQAEFGAYLCLVVFELIIGMLRDEKTGKLIKQGISHVIQAVVLALLYQKSVSAYIANSPYSSSHASMVSLNAQGMKTVLYNLKEYIKIINMYVSAYKPLVLIVGVACLISFIFLLKNFYQRSTKTMGLKILDTVIMIISPVILLLLSLSLLIVLKSPVFGCRTMISMTVLYLIIGIALAYLVRQLRSTHIIMGLCILFSLTLIYSYGNLAKSQKVHEESLTQSIVYDLRSLEKDHTITSIALSGSYTYSKQMIRVNQNNKFYQKLVPNYLDNNSMWGGYEILSAIDTPTKFKMTTQSDLNYIKMHKSAISNKDYAIYVIHQKAVIYFNHGSHTVMS